MKRLLIIFFFIDAAMIAHSQNLDFLNRTESEVNCNETYGEYERNKFDIILPSEDLLHGLVIYIHGGGFKHGDKSELYKRKDDILFFLDNNIAVATINYRFYKTNDSLGVMVCLQDIKKAIQFIRLNASKYNIDKTRIGCYGVSAGAGASLYFAFHDEMASQGDSTILGESTRIKCAGAISSQSTYNVFLWKKIIPWFRLVFALKRKTFCNAAANFYGYPDYNSFKKDRKEIIARLDLLTIIDNQDPPIYLMNLLKEHFPKNINVIEHHRAHAVAVSKRLNKYNVQSYLYTYKQAKQEEDIDFSIKEFLVEHLK